MKKFRVEFNTTGIINEGVWETLDEIAEMNAANAQDAIEYAIDWFVETDLQSEYGDDEITEEQLKDKYLEYAWRAFEVGTDNNEYEYLDRD